jgi:hypothetical protein
MPVKTYRLVRERPNRTDHGVMHYRIDRKVWFWWWPVARECFVLESKVLTSEFTLANSFGDDQAREWFAKYLHKPKLPPFPETIDTKDVTS